MKDFTQTTEHARQNPAVSSEPSETSCFRVEYPPPLELGSWSDGTWLSSGDELYLAAALTRRVFTKLLVIEAERELSGKFCLKAPGAKAAPISNEIRAFE